VADSLCAFRDGDKPITRQGNPQRVVLTIESIGPKPDPEYTTVLIRIRLADNSFMEFEVGAGDAQRLGHAINAAGGGVLKDATELRKALRVAVEGMRMVPFGETVDGAWGDGFTKALVKSEEALKDD
jgi:hypothetical protein